MTVAIAFLLWLALPGILTPTSSEPSRTGASQLSTDWMVERSEFELSVPVFKLSDDNVVL